MKMKPSTVVQVPVWDHRISANEHVHTQSTDLENLEKERFCIAFLFLNEGLLFLLS